MRPSVSAGQRLVVLLVASLGLGLLAGGAVSLFAFYLARYGPSGEGWSLRGNGALVAYSLVPVFLVGGWTAIILRYKTHPAWLSLGLGAGLVGLTLAAIDALLLPVFGTTTDQAVGFLLLSGLLLWTVAGPVIAILISRGTPPRPGSLWAHLGAEFMWLGGTLLGLVGVGTVIPAGT